MKMVMIIINDRKQEFIDKNLSLCEINCDYIKYDKSTKQSSCNCLIKNKIDYISEIINRTNKVSTNISSEKSDSGALNINTIKCTKELFSKEGLINNISSYILLIIIMIFLLSILFFIKCGYKLLEDKINNIIEYKRKTSKIPSFLASNGKKNIKKNKVKKRNIKLNYPPQRNNNINLINNSNKIKNKEQFLKYKKKDFKRGTPSGNTKYMKNKNRNYQKTNNKNNYKNKKIVNNKSNQIIKREFNIFELNTLDYKEAILYDKRTFCDYYLSLLKIKHPLIFSFCPIQDYNTIIIKLCISILSFSVSYFLNFIFFDEKTIHKIYKDEGKYDFIYFIPKISISFGVSHFVFILIKFIFLSERNLLNIKKQKTINSAQEIASNEKRNLIIKYTLFFIIGIIFLSFFWMLLSSFGAVYQNTQIIVFENTLICLGISLAYPFFINILPCILRIPSLNSESKDQSCLYNLSKFLQIL